MAYEIYLCSFFTACGGSLTATTGVIRSPISNGKYLTNQNCTWQISLPTGVAVQLRFGFIDIEQAGNCAKDYVEIRNGIAPDSPVLGKYCGNNIPAVINSTNNQVSVRFVTDGATQLTGFNLTYNRYVEGNENFYSQGYFLNFMFETRECSAKFRSSSNKTYFSFSLKEHEIIISVSPLFVVQTPPNLA